MNSRTRSDYQLQRHLLQRIGMLKIAGVVTWIALFALVLTSVIRSEKINATPHSVGQLHHTGKTKL
jgi:hypothetical protein